MGPSRGAGWWVGVREGLFVGVGQADIFLLLGVCDLLIRLLFLILLLLLFLVL